jgi:hypothetical protein
MPTSEFPGPNFALTGKYDKKHPFKEGARQYNASMQYRDAKKKKHRFEFYLMSYTQPFQLAGSHSQSRRFQHFYAKSYAPGDMSITGRSVHQTQYNNLAEYIREFHNRMLNATPASNAKGDFIPLIHLEVPVEGINVHGLIKSFKAGARRFNVAPQFTFDFTVIRTPMDKTDWAASSAIHDTWSGHLVKWAHPQPKKKKHHKPKHKHVSQPSRPTHPGQNP